MGASKKKVKEKKESKLIYVPFIVLVVVLVVILMLPSIKSVVNPSSSSSGFPLFQMLKVSNTDYASGNSVEVYFISWLGCPYGASDSWALYEALSHYGQINATPIYSDSEGIPEYVNSFQTITSEVPGLQFTSPFKPNSTVQFHFIYLIGRIFTNNNSFSLLNGTILTYSGDSIVNFELNELKQEAPSWVYNLITQYQINENPPGSTEPIAYEGNPPHIASTIIITGPKGTYMMIGYDQSANYNEMTPPAVLAQSGLTPQQIFQGLKNNDLPPQVYDVINSEAQQILSIIQNEMG